MQWTAGLGALAGIALAAPVGCGQAPESTGALGNGPSEGVAEAKQGATSAQVCLNIARAGAAGTVFDAQIANKVPLSKNYGASGTMNTGSIAGEERQSLVRFDLSAIPPGPNTNIITASVAFALGQTGASGPGTIQLHRVTAPWNESTVSWQSFGGAFDPTIEATMNNGSPFMGTNVHNLVVGWVHGTFPNHGLLLEQPGPNTTNLWTSEYPNFFSRPSLYVCYNVTCNPGFADCNNNGTDGCETDLTTSAANCGACGQACSLPNATPACVASTCQVGSCNLGFGDCDGIASNGCETLLTTNTNCGGCGVACALPNAAASCSSGTCTLTACNPGSYDCDGNAANGCESLPCGNGSHCASGAGCTSGVCIGGFCASPACNDGVKNGSETAVDCGGGSCPPCTVGQTCAAGSDCASGVCNSGICQAPTCSDSVKNGNETAADCGGSCSPCANGLGCNVGADCASGVCTAGTCQAPACNDSVKNGAETAVDCGGGTCPPCAVGKACVAGSDCVDLVCSGNVCQMANCTDGVQNGSETDVDCGGPCPACNTAAHCTTNADCGSGVCVGGICQAATCTDGVQNGNETGVDCGGACFVPETCNGLDEDCNGLVDDGLGSTTCGVGACQVTVQNCVGGQVQLCTPLAPTPEVCDGLLDDDCDGVVDNGCNCVDGHTQSCYTASPATLGIGVCAAGIQTCVHGQWGACNGEITPTAETCDGLDNDCDGLADDGLGQTICGIGECQTTQPNCVNGVPQTCVPRPPAPETCDNLDNDCDGVIDNNLPVITCGVGECVSHAPTCVNGQPSSTCTPLAPSAEVCDGLDNDCDGAVDDGNPGGGQGCNTGNQGACAAGTTSCSAGQIVCNQNQQPKAEACDGIDNDCDGVIDNGNPGAGQACTTGQQGICSAGTTVCSGGTLSCQQNQQPKAEACNGLDDDCDGLVDDGNPGGGQSCQTGLQGVCGAGTTVCSGGSVQCSQNVSPSAEVCDGALDQNCNGLIDEGCNCTNGATRPCYSGAAGTTGVGACHGGTQTCANGNWGACVGEVLPKAETCNGVDDNCNGSVDDGLGTISCGVGQCSRTVPACVNGAANTCTPGSPKAETCNGLDDDCNGVVDNGNPGGGQGCNTGLQGICSAGTTVCISGALACNQNQSPKAETCNGLDDNCNGSVDEGNPGGGFGCGTCGQGTRVCSGGTLVCTNPNAGLATYYRDADGDGWGNPGNTTQACSLPGGFVTNNGDCNDGNAGIRPGAAESCNNADDNCNGSVDEGNPGGGGGCNTGQAGICAAGTFICSGGSVQCIRNQNPQGESCNGVDDNCNGIVDEGAGCRNGVHRSYHPSQGWHFYTTNGSEAQCCGYYVENFNYFYLAGSQIPGTVPWYRCANGSWHFMTTASWCEVWGPGALEGTMGFIATSQLPGTTPLYRSYRGQNVDHFYTTSFGEHLNALQANGYIDEGLVGYVWTSP